MRVEITNRKVGHLMRIIVLILGVLATLQAHTLDIEGFAIRYNQGELSVLNQQKLPLEQEWIDVESAEEMAEIIKSLKVRGAPMIGIAAALSLTQLAERGASRDTLESAALLLRNSRPTAF